MQVIKMKETRQHIREVRWWFRFNDLQYHVAPGNPEARWNVLRCLPCPLWVVLVITLRTRKTERECMRSSSDETARLSAIRQRDSGAYGVAEA